MRPFRITLSGLRACKDSQWQIDSFQHRFFRPQKPAFYPRKIFARLNEFPASTKWIKPYKSAPIEPTSNAHELEYDHLQEYGETIVPIERTKWSGDGNAWDVKSFERFEAPLSFFLEWTKQKLADPLNFCPNEGLYIAQCSISTLPQGLQDSLPVPLYCCATSDKHRGQVDMNGRVAQNIAIESSSIWMGIPPTETPLHKDPNSNFLVQLAGYKIVRLMKPVGGEMMLAWAKRAIAERNRAQGMAGRFDMSMRGEEMMVGPERALMSELVWSQQLGGEKRRLLRQLEGELVAEDMEISHSTPEVASDVPMATSQLDDPLNVEYTNEDQAKIEISEAVLSPGDAVFIPTGWYHSVRSAGTAARGINVSANWWFRLSSQQEHRAMRSNPYVPWADDNHQEKNYSQNT